MRYASASLSSTRRIKAGSCRSWRGSTVPFRHRRTPPYQANRRRQQLSNSSNSSHLPTNRRTSNNRAPVAGRPYKVEMEIIAGKSDHGHLDSMTRMECQIKLIIRDMGHGRLGPSPEQLVKLGSSKDSKSMGSSEPSKKSSLTSRSS